MATKFSVQWKFFLGFFCFIAGHLLRPIAMDPDVHFGTSQLLGTFLLFSWWLLGIYSAGACIAYLLRFRVRPHFLALALGSAFAVAVISVAGFVDFIHYDQSWFYSVLLFMSMLCGGLLPRGSNAGADATEYPIASKPVAIILSAAVFASIMLWRLSQAFLVHGYSDPLLYHLVGPRLWTNAGHIYFARQYPFSYQASNWEYLYVWGSILLGEAGGRGLIETQIFSQLTHVLLGSLGAALALYYFLKRTWNHSTWIWLVLLAAFSSHSLAMMSWLAKNDWGVLFWAFAGAAILVFPPEQVSKNGFLREVLAGIFFGLAISTKPTTVLAVVALTFLAFDFHRTDGKDESRLLHRVLLIFSFTLLASIPVSIRNFAATGNPFYPYIETIFPSHQLSSSMQSYLSQLAPHLNRGWIALGEVCENILRDSILSFGLVLVFVALALGPGRRRLALWIGVFLFCSVPFALLEVNGGFLRWMGLGLVFCPMVTVLSVYVLTQRLSAKWKQYAVPLVALLICGCTFPSQIFQSVRAVTEGPSPDEVIRSHIHIGGSAKAWLRLNLKPGEHAYSTGDNELYYILDWGVFSLPENPDFDGRIDALKASNDLPRFIRESKIKYLLDSRHWDGSAWGPFAQYIHFRLSGHTDAIVFESPDAIVIDAEKLADLISPQTGGTKVRRL